MGAGGVIMPPAGYFPKIQAVLDRYDVLFIADEVICGFGRLGTLVRLARRSACGPTRSPSPRP